MSTDASIHNDDELTGGRFVRALVGVGAIAGAILMIELALTRIFSVTMYYHFAFLAISIALFGFSASGVYVYVMRRTFDRRSTASLLTLHSLLFAAATVLALAALVRIRVGLNYSHENLIKMIAIYTLAALPFFSGGAVISLAITRLRKQVNVVYGADLIGAAVGCLLLLPLLNRFGAPGVVLLAAVLGGAAALLFSPARTIARTAAIAALAVGIPGGLQLMGSAPFDVSNTKGHAEDTVLFAKWNSFSRVAVYDRSHGDWSLSSLYKGEKPETRFMDIDSAASTPIVRFDGDLSKVEYLKYELTGLAFHMMKRSVAFTTLVIGPGGGRDLLTALVFGAGRVDGVEVNPIIANDVMLGKFRDFSGSIYQNPRVHVVVDDGRSYIRRSDERYDVIQASLVDTWAATAAGAYTLTENTLYTKEAFEDYYDHLTERGVLTITRWVFDGLRLVSLAQAACESRGCSAADHMAIVQQDRVATFLLKKTAFTTEDVEHLRLMSNRLGFTVLYAPGQTDTSNDYAKLVLAPDQAVVLRRLSSRRLADDRQPPVFLSHHENTRSVSDRVRPQHALRQRPERADDADGDLGHVRHLVRGGTAAALRQRAARQPLAALARILRHARRRLHAHRGRAAAAVRAVARPPRLLAHRHSVFRTARNGHRQPYQPSNQRCRAAAHDPVRAPRHRRCGDSRYRRAAADYSSGNQRHPCPADRADGLVDCACRRADGDALAGGHPADDRAGFRPRSLGVGDERRAVRDRRHSGRVYRDELGVFGHSDDRRRHLLDRRCTSAGFCR